MPLTKSQLAFLAAWNKRPTVKGAAEDSGIDRRSHYEWMKDDPEYAAAFTEARTALIDALESEAFRRAHDGTLKPVYQGGQKVGEIREFSDALMVKLLQANAPDKYTDRMKHHVTGEPIPVRVVELPPEDQD